jgi:hypothetical protein
LSSRHSRGLEGYGCSQCLYHLYVTGFATRELRKTTETNDPVAIPTDLSDKRELVITFFDEHGTQIDTATTQALGPSRLVWKDCTDTGKLPAGAVNARVELKGKTGAGGDVHSDALHTCPNAMTIELMSGVSLSGRTRRKPSGRIMSWCNGQARGHGTTNQEGGAHMKQVKLARGSRYCLVGFLVILAMSMAPSHTRAQQFQKAVRGSHNPEIAWNMGGGDYRLVLDWKSNYDESLQITEASIDSQGYVEVRAQTSCNGCIMRLYRRDGDAWTELDEKKALAYTMYTLQGLPRASQVAAFPMGVGGSQNPEIAWTMNGREFKVVLGWMSNYAQTLNVQEAFFDDQGYINVKADTSCDGCIMRLYEKEDDSWTKLDEKKAESNKTYLLTSRAGEATEAQEFPIRESGNQNPTVTWQAAGKEFKLELWWQNPVETGWIELGAADVTEGILVVSGTTSCDGCWVALYEQHAGGWDKKVIVKSMGKAFSFGYVTE